jgi:serine/threonine protein kinase
MVHQTLAPETIVGSRFKVEHLLGSGGLGELYRAVDQDTNEAVALRLLASDISRSEVAVDQLRSQVRIASKLSHKNVARVFGMGKQGSMRYVASEYVDGHSLREVIERKLRSGQVFSLKSAYNVVAHVCSALRAALQLGLEPSLIHGLPGPGAIRITRAGRVKLCDVGILQAIPSGSATLGRLGDRDCMAPEFEASPADATPAADIYSLGIVLYEMLAGHPPAGGYTPVSQLLPTISEQTDRVIRRCIQSDPMARYGNPDELKLAIYEALQDAPQDQHLATASTFAAAGTPENNVPVAQQASPAPAPRMDSPDEAPRTVDEPAASPAARAVAAATVAPATAPPAPPQPSREHVTSPAALANTMQGTQAPHGAPAPAIQAGSPLAFGATGPYQVQSVPSAPAATAALAPTASIPAPRIEDLLTAPIPDDYERWLVRKDGLDFGPFTLGEVKQQLFKGEFGGEEELVDQDSGERVPTSRHPALAEFIRALQIHRQNEEVEKARAESSRRSRRRRAVVLTMVSLSLAALATSGVVFYWLTRNPEVIEKTVEVPGEAKLSLDITWKNEPKAQAEKRKALRRRRRKRKAKDKRAGSGRDEQHVTYLGDASKAGGDELLSQQQIEATMKQNLVKLSRCVLKQAREDSSLSRVAIDFGVKGDGNVSYVRVNGQKEGTFQACIMRSMRRIRFPKYDGSLTRASFAMNINR